MGGIPHGEREYAIIDRLQSLLPFDDAEYKASECYAVFSTLLCWTLQRVRSREDPVSGLYDELVETPVTDFLNVQTEAFDDGELGEDDENTDDNLNDLSIFMTAGGETFSAMEVLIALRNAVAHPNISKVHPIIE